MEEDKIVLPDFKGEVIDFDNQAVKDFIQDQISPISAMSLELNDFMGTGEPVSIHENTRGELFIALQGLYLVAPSDETWAKMRGYIKKNLLNIILKRQKHFLPVPELKLSTFAKQEKNKEKVEFVEIALSEDGGLKFTNYLNAFCKLLADEILSATTFSTATTSKHFTRPKKKKK